MIEGHQKDTREMYEASRLGAYLSILPHLSKSDRLSLTPQKLFKFEWEVKPSEPKEVQQQTAEHFKKLGDLYRSGKIIPKENGKSKN